MLTPEARSESLIEALPYIQRFRGQTFVIKYGGAAMEEEHIVERFLRDVVFLEAVGINPVLVHGGGKAITAKMRAAGLKARFVNGLRVTDAQSIDIVSETLDQEINPKIVETILKYGGKARGFSGRTVFGATRMGPQEEGGEKSRAVEEGEPDIAGLRIRIAERLDALGDDEGLAAPVRPMLHRPGEGQFQPPAAIGPGERPIGRVRLDGFRLRDGEGIVLRLERARCDSDVLGGRLAGEPVDDRRHDGAASV